MIGWLRPILTSADYDFIENRNCSHINFEISCDVSENVVWKSADFRAILGRVKTYHVRLSTNYSISLKFGRRSPFDLPTFSGRRSILVRLSRRLSGDHRFLRSQTSDDIWPITFFTQSHLIDRSSVEYRATIGRILEKLDDFEASGEPRGAGRFFSDFCFIERRRLTSR